MTSKERVMKSMNGEKIDHVPLFYRDVPEVEKRLKKDLGLKTRDEILEYFQVDFRWISPAYIGPDLGDPASGKKKNIFGVEFIKCNSGGHGVYWEPIKFPLSEVEDPAELEDYQWPKVEWFDFSVLEEQLDRYKDYAIMTAPGEATSPGVLASIQDLFGMEKTLMDMYINPQLWKKTVDKILEFNLSFIEKLYEVAGDRIDFYRIGEDYGTQRGLLFGPDQWKEFIQPTLREMIAIPKKYGSSYYHHTCGGVRELIPLLIETGVDVMDPIQILADGMNPADLKKEFGKQLCFSGGIDEQQILPKGTPEEVKREVFRMLDTLGPGGGYFLGSTHNFQDDIPTENKKAMYSAGLEWEPK